MVETCGQGLGLCTYMRMLWQGSWRSRLADFCRRRQINDAGRPLTPKESIALLMKLCVSVAHIPLLRRHGLRIASSDACLKVRRQW